MLSAHATHTAGSDLLTSTLSSRHIVRRYVTFSCLCCRRRLSGNANKPAFLFHSGEVSGRFHADLHIVRPPRFFI